jgi:hypothetical protein
MLPATLAFDYPSIAAISEFIEDNCQQALAAVHSSSAATAAASAAPEATRTPASPNPDPDLTLAPHPVAGPPPLAAARAAGTTLGGPGGMVVVLTATANRAPGGSAEEPSVCGRADRVTRVPLTRQGGVAERGHHPPKAGTLCPSA